MDLEPMTSHSNCGMRAQSDIFRLSALSAASLVLFNSSTNVSSTVAFKDASRDIRSGSTVS
jgi:hypothetical protein